MSTVAVASIEFTIFVTDKAVLSSYNNMLSGSTQPTPHRFIPVISSVICHLNFPSLFPVIYFVLTFSRFTEESFLHNVNNQKNDLPPISRRHFSGYLSHYTFPKIFP